MPSGSDPAPHFPRPLLSAAARAAPAADPFRVAAADLSCILGLLRLAAYVLRRFLPSLSSFCSDCSSPCSRPGTAWQWGDTAGGGGGNCSEGAEEEAAEPRGEVVQDGGDLPAVVPVRSRVRR